MANCEKENQSSGRHDRQQLIMNAELFHAIYRKYEGEVNEVEERKLVKLKKCLINGADINAVDRNNQDNTVLHTAIENNYSKIVKYLLTCRARTDIENSKGKNALALARTRRCNQEILNMLDIHSKDLNIEDLSGNEQSRSIVKINDLTSKLVLWNKLRNNSEMAVLEIDSCELSPDILHQVELYDAIDTARNLFFVDVMLSHKQHIDENFIKSQLNRLNKQLIIQCGSILNTKVYCRDSYRHINVINLNSPVEHLNEITLTDKLSRKGLGIGVIIEMVKLNLVGTFVTERRSLLNVSFDFEKHFNGWNLIDHAIRYGDVITVRLLSLSNWNLSRLNPKGTNTLSIAAEHGDVDKLGAVLRLKFPIQLDKSIAIPEKTAAHFDKCKRQMLETSVRARKSDVISFMIRCGLQLDENIFELAWFSKQYDVVFTLLKADCIFPTGFDLDKIDLNNERLAELRSFVADRKRLHKLIEEGDLESVKVLVKSIAPSKLYLNTDNKSALYRALNSKNVNLFVWLKNELKAEFRDNERKRLGDMGELSRASDALLPHLVPIDNAHIFHLVEMSRYRQHYEGFKKHIENVYTELNNIPQISTVFKVIHFCTHVDIIYDFDRDSIIDINVAGSESETGLCEYKAGRIYIGAKVDKRQLLGTIAHELTHLAMQLIFENDGKPYIKSNDFLINIFDEIIKEIRKQSMPMDDIIRSVFRCYGKSDWPSELIVRVNQMLATYGSGEGLSRLEMQAKSLLKYYTYHVEPKFESLLAECHLLRPQNTVKSLNKYSGVIDRLDEIQIYFKESKVVKEFNDSKVRQILVLSSSSTWLGLINVYQTIKEISLSIHSLLVFQFHHYLNRKLEINEALFSEAGKLLVLECPNDLPENKLEEALSDLFKIFLAKQDRKVIFIVDSNGLGSFQNYLQRNLSKNCFEIVLEEFTLNSLMSYCIQNLLMQNVSLQNRLVPLGHLVDSDSYSLVDAEILTKLVNKEKVSLGKQPIDSYGFDEVYYIDRAFIRLGPLHTNTVLDDTRPIRMFQENDLVNHIYYFRVVLVSDTAGMGKTTVLNHIIKRLNSVLPNLWVIRVDLYNYTKAFKKPNYAITNDDEALNFFVNAFFDSQMESKLDTKFERNLLLHLVKNGDDRIVIMIDGFDEIEEKHQTVVICILNALKHSKVKQLWVTTRPNINNNLENVWQMLPYTLKPFSEEDQITMLSSYWTHKLGVVHQERLRYYVVNLVKIFRPINVKPKPFIGIPLQTMMIAEVFEEHCLKFCHYKMANLNLPNHFDLTDLYKMFIEYKLKIYHLEKCGLDLSMSQAEKQMQTTLKDYQISALFTLFDEADRNLLLTQLDIEAGLSFIKAIEGSKGNTGVIDRIVNGRPHFVHLTIAEYLIAEFMVDILKRTELNDKLEKYILISVFGNPALEVVRAFIDSHMNKIALPIESLTNYGVQLKKLWCEGGNPLKLTNGHTILHVAAKEGNVNIVKFILTSVEMLGESGKSTLDSLVTAKDDLLKYGVDVNVSFPTSALHIAASKNFGEIAEYLIASGADVNVADKDGLTPLHEAVEKCHPSLVQLLLGHGADPNAESLTTKIKPIDLALRRKDQKEYAVIIKMLEKTLNC